MAKTAVNGLFVNECQLVYMLIKYASDVGDILYFSVWFSLPDCLFYFIYGAIYLFSYCHYFGEFTWSQALLDYTIICLLLIRTYEWTQVIDYNTITHSSHYFTQISKYYIWYYGLALPGTLRIY